MRMNILVIFLLLACFISVNAQQRGKAKKRSHIEHIGFESDYFHKGKPSIDISYGLSNAKLKDSEIDFPRNGMIDLKLGFKYIGEYKPGNIVRFRNSFVHGSIISPQIDLKSNDLEAETWRFGMGSATGYGYKISKKTSLVFHNSNSFTWTGYDGNYSAFPYDSSSYNGIFPYIVPFNESFRFGTGTEAGILIPVWGIFGLQIQYDRTLVFPRHLFWKWLGSSVIEFAAQGAIDGFIRAILKSTPEAVPIVDFILKNGLSYGLYELRRDKMNWPFNSEKPLLFDSFKLGFTFTF